MGLKTLKVPRVVYPAGGSDDEDPVRLRGLSFNDLNVLFAQHQELALQVFEVIKIARKNGDLTLDATGGIVLRLITEAPALAAGAIALAADEPEAMDMVLTMPLQWQIGALEKIAELTFGEGEGLKKFGPTLMQMLEMAGSQKK